MRLKRLHIRNIASIEKGDIDFESGLRDEAGDNATLFLITGDTGAGKSVILDCISMALFRKTPRQNGVSNRRQNEYRTSEGEMLGVGAIEQYTRIGISAKDECFSELVFEGNDGEEYTARLDLGMMRQNGAKRGALKHRASSWKVRKGDADWLTGVSEVEHTIRDAIGITFEQFGRMSMLAQGQFAAFLTGEKKEREAILEQLTSTGRFSTYGEAIRNIFRRKSESAATLRTEYEMIAARRLSPEEKEECTNRLTAIAEETKTLDARLDLLGRQKMALMALADIEKETRDNTVRLARLEELHTGEEQRKLRELVAGWDATTARRAQLAELRRHRKTAAAAEALLPELRGEYLTLYADIVARLRQETETKENADKELAWLDARKARAQIMRQADTIAVHLANYRRNEDTADRSRQTLESELKRLPILRKEIEEAEGACEKSAAEVKVVHDGITECNARLKNIDHAALIRSRDEEQQKLLTLGNLRSDIEKYEKTKSQVSAASNEVAGIKERLGEMEKRVTEAEKDVQKRGKEVEEALKIHDLLRKGVEKAMNDMRGRMIESGVDTCPLCGQHISHWDHAEELVNQAIRPASDRLDALRGQHREAEERLRQLRKEESEAKGRLDTEQKHIKEKKRERDAIYGGIHATAVALGMIEKNAGATATTAETSAEGAVEEEIITRLRDTEIEKTREAATRRLHELQTQIEGYETITARLTELNTTLKPLDKTLKEKEKVLTEARQKKERTDIGIEELNGRIASAREANAEIEKGMPEGFGEIYAGWQTTAEDTVRRLRADSAEWTEHTDKLEKYSKEGERLTLQIQNLDGIRLEILRLYPEWSGEVAAAPAEHLDVDAEWRRLYRRCAKNKEDADTSEKEILRLGSELQEYYAESGKDEEYLLRLSEKEGEVAQARKATSTLDADLKSVRDAITHLARRKEETMRNLAPAEGKEIPDTEAVDTETAEKTVARDTLNVNKGEIERRLAEAKATEADFSKVHDAYEKAKNEQQKWGVIDSYFGGTRFRTLVQSHILRPLLNNANIYLSRITDQYRLTCSDDNEQLSILVLDRYNKDQVRSVTVLSGGERFMISLALSLALSSLNRADMNVDILFIDEGFGTLDEKMLDSVMGTLERLQEIAGQAGRRVGVISHREELDERIPVKIRVRKRGEGRSVIEVNGGAEE